MRKKKQQRATPKWNQWKDEDYWSITETIQLISGMEPTDLQPASAEALFDKNKDMGLMYRRLKNACQAGTLHNIGSITGWIGHTKGSPTEFLSFLEKKGHPIPQELSGLLSAQIKTEEVKNEEVGDRERMTYNNIIAALLETITRLGNSGETKLVDELVEKYYEGQRWAGMSKTTLTHKFAEAKKGPRNYD